MWQMSLQQQHNFSRKETKSKFQQLADQRIMQSYRPPNSICGILHITFFVVHTAFGTA